MDNIDLGVLTGEKPLKHELILKQNDLLKVAGVVFLSMLFAIVIGNIITKR